MKAIIPIVILTVLGVMVSMAIHGGVSLPKWSSDKPERQERSEKPAWLQEADEINRRMAAEADERVRRMLEDPTYTVEAPAANLKEAREREEQALQEAIEREKSALGEAMQREREALNQAIFDASGEIP